MERVLRSISKERCGDNGAEMLISAFRSRKSISGPELAG